MSSPERRKGFQFERDLVNIYKSHGIEAKRSWGSVGADITLPNGKTISCKRRKNGMLWAYDELEKYDSILFKADRKPILEIKIWAYQK